MSMDIFQRVRELAKSVKEERSNEKEDVHYMTAPCGLPCFECFLYLAQFNDEMAEIISGFLNLPPEKIKCKGCRAEGGKCAHLPMDCRVYHCTEQREIKTCAECRDFPCDFLHPYMDQAEKWHNTKVYHLCLIKKTRAGKMGERRGGRYSGHLYLRNLDLITNRPLKCLKPIISIHPPTRGDTICSIN